MGDGPGRAGTNGCEFPVTQFPTCYLGCHAGNERLVDQHFHRSKGIILVKPEFPKGNRAHISHGGPCEQNPCLPASLTVNSHVNESCPAVHFDHLTPKGFRVLYNLPYYFHCFCVNIQHV